MKTKKYILKGLATCLIAASLSACVDLEPKAMSFLTPITRKIVSYLSNALVYISLFSFEYLYLIIVLSDYKVMSTPNVQMRGVMALVKGSEVLHLEITNALSTLILNLRLSIINLLINFFGNV